MFNGIHCPKCGKRVRKRSARSYSCCCGWRYISPESNIERIFIYGPYRKIKF